MNGFDVFWLGVYIAIFVAPIILILYLLFDTNRIWKKTFGRDGKAKFKRRRRR